MGALALSPPASMRRLLLAVVAASAVERTTRARGTARREQEEERRDPAQNKKVINSQRGFKRKLLQGLGTMGGSRCGMVFGSLFNENLKQSHFVRNERSS